MKRMPSIVLIDTTVYLNILDVPGRNQDRESVFTEFEAKIDREDTFLLPMASIWETGNHIAKLRSGADRRRWAQILVESVRQAINGGAPFRPTYFPDKDVFLDWIADFPEHANRSKSAAKPNEGGSLADMSIIKEWERITKLNRMSVVEVWSLDVDLSGYIYSP